MSAASLVRFGCDAEFGARPNAQAHEGDNLVIDAGFFLRAAPRTGADNQDRRAYFHSQSLLFVFPSASALYSKIAAIAFRRRKFGESL